MCLQNRVKNAEEEIYTGGIKDGRSDFEVKKLCIQPFGSKFRICQEHLLISVTLFRPTILENKGIMVVINVTINHALLSEYPRANGH